MRSRLTYHPLFQSVEKQINHFLFAPTVLTFADWKLCTRVTHLAHFILFLNVSQKAIGLIWKRVRCYPTVKPPFIVLWDLTPARKTGVFPWVCSVHLKWSSLWTSDHFSEPDFPSFWSSPIPTPETMWRSHQLGKQRWRTSKPWLEAAV